MTIKEVSEKYGITQDTLRYYERVGMIPTVTRTAGGIRDYQESDLAWVELALCMRSAGLPIEAMIDYVRMFQQGDSTIPARLQLLSEQKEALIQQRKNIDETLQRLDYKISRYQEAVKTGRLVWEAGRRKQWKDPEDRAGKRSRK
ncbi:MAG: MerR family transcriptional regulator [Solobacterium sp.]|nr:MerR family transcriptional regulator [Solobacterium sp.]MCH4222221.1 MerR family transcriptional regulator [Solobacterium sp.]MCH4265741.1 MerR family transcriptional regulator [Solobacterium sp.]